MISVFCPLSCFLTVFSMEVLKALVKDAGQHCYGLTPALISTLISEVFLIGWEQCVHGVGFCSLDTV